MQQSNGVASFAVAGDVDLAAGGERGEELPDGDIEALGGALNDDGVVIELKGLDLGLDVIVHAGVVNHCAFGFASGPGSVEHVGE